MNKLILLAGFLSALLVSSVAFADTTASCSGSLMVVVGVDGPDTMTAVNAKFTMKMKADKTSTLVLENKYAKPITGTGKETGNEKAPWALEAKDADGQAFKGGLIPVKGAYPGDTTLYMMLELKSDKIAIAGLMTCTMK